MSPARPDEVIRGQYRGYRDEEGVDPHPTVETYVALCLEIDSWRWAGVPFLVRAGKALAVTATECVIRFKAPPRLLFSHAQTQPDPERARLPPRWRRGAHHALMAKAPGDVFATKEIGLDVSFEAALGPRQEPYERLLEDALDGDPRRFARADSVSEAWRVVQPVLDHPEPDPPVRRGHDGAGRGRRPVRLNGGWHDPTER
jgi:glucose-6-phosphate 1-dehydrogenase